MRLTESSSFLTSQDWWAVFSKVEALPGTWFYPRFIILNEAVLLDTSKEYYSQGSCPWGSHSRCTLFPLSSWGLNSKLAALRHDVSSEFSPLGDVLSLNSVKYLMFFNHIFSSSSMCLCLREWGSISSIYHVTKTFYL